MKSSLGDLMKQAQKMQENMQQAQQKQAQKEVEGSAGAGMVTVLMNGRYDVKRVCIDDIVLTEDKAVLEDLLAAAVNDAVKKIEASNSDLMAGLTAGLNIPGDFKMPF